MTITLNLHMNLVFLIIMNRYNPLYFIINVYSVKMKSYTVISSYKKLLYYGKVLSFQDSLFIKFMIQM